MGPEVVAVLSVLFDVEETGGDRVDEVLLEVAGVVTDEERYIFVELIVGVGLWGLVVGWTGIVEFRATESDAQPVFHNINQFSPKKKT